MTADESSIDVNEPVENPALVAAIQEYARNQTQQSQDRLAQVLKAARYLVPFIGDEGVTGSRLKFPQLKLSDEKFYVPVFTDWGEIRKWTDVKINTLVLSMGDLHALFGPMDDIAGVVLNVGSEPMVLKKAHLSGLGRDHCGA